MANELVPLSAAEYPMLDPDNKVLAVIRENMDGQPLELQDLKISMPTGGSTNWTFPDGTTQPALECVILNKQPCRAWWGDQAIGEGPPLCSSADNVQGLGDPQCECLQLENGAFDCITCPRSQPGSKPGGGRYSRDCGEGRALLLLVRDRPLPVFLLLTPGSLWNFNRFMGSLAGTPYRRIVAHFGLAKATSENGKPYAKLVPKILGRLDGKACAAVEAIRKEYEPAFRSFRAQPADFMDGDETKKE